MKKVFLLSLMLLLSLVLPLTGQTKVKNELPLKYVTAAKGTNVLLETEDSDGVPVYLSVAGGTSIVYNPNVEKIVYDSTSITPFATPITDEYSMWKYTESKNPSIQGVEYYTVASGSTISKTISTTFKLSSSIEIGAKADAGTIFSKVCLSGKVALGTSYTTTESVKVTFSSGKYKYSWGQRVDTVKGWYEHRDKYGKITKSKNVLLKIGYAKFYTTERL